MWVDRPLDSSTLIQDQGRPSVQIGVDSFAAAFDETSLAVNPSERVRNLVDQIEHADRVGLDIFGIGESAARGHDVALRGRRRFRDGP
jgi:hypothetical protein